MPFPTCFYCTSIVTETKFAGVVVDNWLNISNGVELLTT